MHTNLLKDVSNFMASQGSQIFNTLELLGMKKNPWPLLRPLISLQVAAGSTPVPWVAISPRLDRLFLCWGRRWCTCLCGSGVAEDKANFAYIHTVGIFEDHPLNICSDVNEFSKPHRCFPDQSATSRNPRLVDKHLPKAQPNYTRFSKWVWRI